MFIDKLSSSGDQLDQDHRQTGCCQLHSPSTSLWGMYSSLYSTSLHRPAAFSMPMMRFISAADL